MPEEMELEIETDEMLMLEEQAKEIEQEMVQNMELCPPSQEQQQLKEIEEGFNSQQKPKEELLQTDDIQENEEEDLSPQRHLQIEPLTFSILSQQQDIPSQRANLTQEQKKVFEQERKEAEKKIAEFEKRKEKSKSRKVT
jgi:hypothetical protein